MSNTLKLPTVWKLTKAQFHNPPVLTSDLSGKTVVVLGASRGLGFEAAKHFASMKPERLILLCRSRKLGDEAASEIKSATGYGECQVGIVDLRDLSSVKQFAKNFQEEGGRLDIILANAATTAVPNETLTPDGWEPTYQTNNFSTHFLCLLLLPSMLATAEKYNTTPRITIVTSSLHYMSKLDKKFLQDDNPTLAFGKHIPSNSDEVMARYNDTKLFNVLFAVGLASHLKEHRIIVNCVDPGYCISHLRRSFEGGLKVFSYLLDIIFARSTEEGSRQLIWAALANSEDKEKMNGTFATGLNTYLPSKFVTSDKSEIVAFKQKLWATYLDEVFAVQPELRYVLNQ